MSNNLQTQSLPYQKILQKERQIQDLRQALYLYHEKSSIDVKLLEGLTK